MYINIEDVLETVIKLGGKVTVLEKPGGKDKKKGKAPILPGWNKNPFSTKEEVEKALRKYRGHNWGLVLGSHSNMVAIDVDGQGGEEVLSRFSGGDLPITVEYLTPGGGRRLIYAIPDEYKGVTFEKKFEKVKGREHEECALLGEGQQTVLPLSKNGIGKRYEFVQGRTFDDVKIADAPMWMIKLMTEKDLKKTTIDKDPQELNKLGELFSSCSNYTESLRIQRSDGLSEPEWFGWISLLIACHLDNEAMMFSSLSSKHDSRSESRIKSLIKGRDKANLKPTRCSTLGCSREKIIECRNLIVDADEKINCSPISIVNDMQVENHVEITKEELLSMHLKKVDEVIEIMLEGDLIAYLQEDVLESLVYLDENAAYEFTSRVEKIRKLGSVSKDDFEKRIRNHRKKLANQQKDKMTYGLKKKKKIGFRYDAKGKFDGINANVFSRHILSKYQLVLKNTDNIYLYKDGYYQLMSEHELMKLTRNEFHIYEPDKWCKLFHDSIALALKLDMENASKLKKPINMLNFSNGILNMKTMDFIEHSDDYFTTSRIKVDFDVNAECPKFMSTLEDMMQGDIELIRLIQEIMGYCISYEVKAEKVFIFVGEGSNGKSLISRIIMEICGKENTSTLSMSDLEKPFERFQLVDKLLNVSTENELGSKGLNSEPLKILSSGERITVEEKFKMSFPYEPYVKLLFAANRLPFSKDKSFGLARRLIIVPFKKQYVANPKSDKQGKMDVNLFENLLEELPGILNFAILGFARLSQNQFQFTESKASKEILNDYKVEINPILDFYYDMIKTTSIRGTVDKKDVYLAFIDWCEENNYKSQMNTGQRKFTRELKSILITENIEFREAKRNGKSFFDGIALKS